MRTQLIIQLTIGACAFGFATSALAPVTGGSLRPVAPAVQYNDSAPPIIDFNQTARKEAEWKRENPWWVLPEWRDVTNQQAVIDRLLTKNMEEIGLLNGAGQGNSPRAKQLSVWLTNEHQAANDLRTKKLAIEEQWRLDHFYGTNRPVEVITQPVTAESTKTAKKEADARVLKFNQELADKGDPYGQLRMGERYLAGEGVEKDLTKAREMFQKSAAQGNADAAAALAKLPPP
jgi:hypothetical protein